MRLHLGWTNLAIPGLHLLSKTGAPGDIMTPEYYLQLMTMHGTIMVFFVLTTAPFAAFGNFFLPIQVGAEDMPFPRFNMMSFWVTFVAFAVLMGFAALNKWRLVPAMEVAQAQSLPALRRSMLAEFCLIIGVLAVTATMTTFFSPEAQAMQ